MVKQEGLDFMKSLLYNKYYVDLHVHIGRSSGGRYIKMATASNLTFENIAHESYYRKGIDIIGVVDCISPYVLEDIDDLIQRDELTPKNGGGMNYKGGQTLLLGAEIETHEAWGCSAHSLCFMPTLEQTKAFSKEMSRHVKNIRTCCSMSHLSGQELFNIVDAYGGIYIPAHVFTPHKSFYGNCCTSLHSIFDTQSFEKIPAIELGLSADSMMASQLSELDKKTFISDSDAHSLAKIGREYNIFEMEDTSFEEVLKALKNVEGRRVAANYGLNPMLGKYHRSYCLACDRVLTGNPPAHKCNISDKHTVLIGVKDRFEAIKDRDNPSMKGRPAYQYQIPLDFIPKVGVKTIDRLIERFGDEMKILHDVSFKELTEVVNEDIAKNIILARNGKMGIKAGGGGIYGRIEEL